jgi:putative DNA primase/helicase
MVHLANTDTKPRRPAKPGEPSSFSEIQLAHEFVSAYRNDLRYVPEWGHWYVWGRAHWERDTILTAFNRAREICEAQAWKGLDDFNTRIASAKAVAATVTLARANPAIATKPEQWDNNPWLFNTVDTIDGEQHSSAVDLRTGKLSKPKPEDFCTKAGTGIPYRKAKCKLWMQFLATVTDGNAELQSYLKRVAGYCLTGSIEESALFFMYGTGANGKSVFVTVLSNILGDYAEAAPLEMLAWSKQERHPTEIAKLRGARLATATETEKGAKWAESKIKALTGGDKVTARFMRQDFFDFTPQFKLLISGNHKPGLSGVDEAIRRRLHLIPFSVTIPPEERDTKLVEKLREERHGILGWMIEGCLEWQRDGLNPPAVVLDATAEYLRDQDAIHRWIDGECETGAQFKAGSSELFVAWQRWAINSEEPPGSQKDFVMELKNRGFREYRTNKSRGLCGLRLLSGSSGEEP